MAFKLTAASCLRKFLSLTLASWFFIIALVTQSAHASEAIEINPAAPKRFTKLDEGMPGDIDFNVLAKDRLSEWDDEELILTSERVLQGMYQAWGRVGNG